MSTFLLLNISAEGKRLQRRFRLERRAFALTRRIRVAMARRSSSLSIVSDYRTAPSRRPRAVPAAREEAMMARVIERIWSANSRTSREIPIG